MARTAVISGTATAVSGNVARRQQSRAQSTAPAGQSGYPAPAPQPAAPPADDLIAKLQQLGDLHAQGVLDDDEFAVAKAKLLST